MWTLWNKIYFIKNSFWKFYEVGVYFDAAVVFVKKTLLLFRIGSEHTVIYIKKNG